MSYSYYSTSNASNGRRNRDDAQTIINAWRNTLPDSKVYKYDGDYITSNTDFVEDVADRCAYNKTGEIILLSAPTGSGKTHFVCDTLDKKINEKTDGNKTLIMCVPNNIQAWQCHADYGTFVIAGDSAEKFNMKRKMDKRVYTAVYECIDGLMAKATASELANVVLVVDECHQLLTESTYRSFTGIMHAVDAVVAAGGVVICMSATPRPIMYLWRYNEYIVAERADGKKTNIEHIEYATIKRKNIKRKHDAVLQVVRDAIDDKRMAIVRYQSKSKIDAAAETLRKEGRRVAVLTADSKGKSVDKEGHIVYDSPIYGGIINGGVLPDVDVLFVTSVLEVGTSIKGILRSGKVVKDETILPIFVCSKGTGCQTDVDRMIQFFARFRFPVNQAKIVACECQNPTEFPVDLNDGADNIILNFATSLYLQRTRIAEAIKYDMYRRYLVSWHGHTDGQGITDDGKVDMALLWADCVQRYFNLIWTQKDAAKVILKTEFGVPVTTTTIDEAEKNGKVTKGVRLSEDTKSAFAALLSDDKAILAIAESGRNKKVSNFCKACPEGKALVDAIRPYAKAEMALDIGVIPRDVAIKAAIYKIEEPRGKYIDDNTKCVITADMAADAVYIKMASWGRDAAMLILDNYTGLREVPAEGYSPAVLACNPNILDIMQGDKWNDFVAMWEVFRTLDSKTKYDKMRNMMQFFAYHDAAECRKLRYEYTMIYLNRADKNADYRVIISPTTSYVGAEHAVLTHPERYLYEAKADKTGKIDRRYTGKAWFAVKGRGAFVGHLLSADDIDTIAKGMRCSISKLAGKNGIHGDYYSANDIFEMMQCAYSHTFQTTDKKSAMCASYKDMKDRNLRMRVCGLRYNAPRPLDAVLSDDAQQTMIAQTRTQTAATQAQTQTTAQAPAPVQKKYEDMTPEELVMIAAETPRDTNLRGWGRLGDIVWDVWRALDRKDIELAMVSAIWDCDDSDRAYCEMMERRYDEEDKEAEETA